ncbi:L-ascorbate metabolism protein UlaG, beta-lactamase superfamily [Amycolatopsis arida]|uniref:L-ascorbate metabolism protein UlaG, beta-lactamase superfamily n=1 Tax=Amycolatopsis arida TaxID=587909 RepID=A0A1I6A5Y7_9PSEU|nr:MBL fold metallo-hydrolase [Amycolatopsis arida]TDX88599.1 L-ascorbate metabolism protein UlaG (beta-lactamase superfamily) [Amycolatopsis arida]SFQ63947.1 L-ascorbate metabolism protein UlaG, beta-lactamase superfamily [Amycolatopsis arida]
MRKGLLAAAAFVGGAAWIAREVRLAMGGRPHGEHAERLLRSPQFRDGMFHNTVPRQVMPRGTYRKALRELAFDRTPRRPAEPVPLVRAATAPKPCEPGKVYVTWYGHSSSLIELDGARVLLDPVWSRRCSPVTFLGPRRLHEPPQALTDLPEVDAVLISHDHYDHLDLGTVRELVRTQRAPFVVPLGVGAHLRRWRVPEDRIVELDWTESVDVAGLRITAEAAQHFSGRGFAGDRTLWASWVVAGPTRRVFYTGDSGYFDGYVAIGERHGPFDAALVQIGAYAPHWPDIHMTPEEAVTAHVDVRGGLLIPVHWATFTLAMHPWQEPADRVWREAKAQDVPLAVPRPGERIDVDAPPPVDGWWQTLAGEPADV